MVSLTALASTFALGLATPLTAVCVIPLYPGFLAYLSAQTDDAHISVGVLGSLVAAGVISFMLGLGLVFTTLLETSLTDVIGVVSPIAFALLGLASLLLLADVKVGQYVPTVEPPQSSHPMAAAFGYGAFFGAIVVPCNPGFVAIFLARSFLFTDPVGSMANFLAFGGGIAAPLVALAVVSSRWQSVILDLLTSHQSLVNRVTGAIMLAISAYYLVAVFEVVPL